MAGARMIPIPPPLYYLAAFGAGMLVDRAVPWPIGGRPWTTVAGAIIGALGLGFTFVAAAGVIRHRTTFVPHREVSALITSGAFRVSRNPMYAGSAIAYIGGVLLAGSWWPAMFLIPAVAAIRYLVIGPEEKYLTERFGKTYVEYRAEVHRWL